MTVRDVHAWATSPTKEYVTATRMNKIGQSFGISRMIGMTTPGVDLVSTGAYMPIDYPQGRFLRVCVQARRQDSSLDPAPEIVLNVETRSEDGGASSDTGSYYGPDDGADIGWPVMDFPACDRLRSPWSWVESGRADNKYDSAGYRLPIVGKGDNQTGHLAELWWIQLSLITFTSAAELDPVAGGIVRRECSPNKQKLLFSLTVNEDTAGDMDYVRNLMVWEWPRHPDTPQFFLDYPYFDSDLWVYKSDESQGMGSKYDLFTGS